MTTSPLVSIVTINYRQAEVTNALLASLRAVQSPAFEVIIVDNASGKEDVIKLDLSDEYVSLIRNDKNLGFAGGNNVGIRQAKGEYILLLNNDTVVAPDFMTHMVHTFETYPKVGAVSPKIRYFDQPDTIQYAGFSEMNPFTMRMHAIGYQEKDEGQYNTPRYTPFAHGCAMMVPRAVIEEVGEMPETYFLYYEEHDWSTQIRRAGYSIYYQPDSLVLHKESISVQKNSPLKTYYLNRNRILYLRRNLRGWSRWLASLYMLFVSIPKNLLQFRMGKDNRHWKAYRDALRWHISPKINDPWTP